MTKTNVSGQSYSADMGCTGPLNGTSHFTITYDTPEHYSGASIFKSTAGGQPMNTTTKFEGKWLKADCGSVKPFRAAQIIAASRSACSARAALAA